MQKKERRRIVRLQVEHDVPVKLILPNASDPIIGRLTDASIFGLGMLVNGVLPLGNVQVSMPLLMPDGESMGRINAEGLVVHTFQREGGYRCGIALINQSQDDQWLIARYIEKLGAEFHFSWRLAPSRTHRKNAAAGSSGGKMWFRALKYIFPSSK